MSENVKSVFITSQGKTVTTKEPKQVIVVRKDLNMRKGKLAAQVAHASMAVILDMMAKKSMLHGKMEEWTLIMSREDALFRWLKGPFVKIVVGVDSEEELMGLYVAASLAKIPNAMIQDAGRTEFHGQPTYTCIGIGPADPEEVDKITGHLKLL
jgi:PTH2 family peptidyl-tRNA hydrolase